MWTNREVEKLATVYECGTPKDEILRDFPDRSWGQIKSMASRMHKKRVRVRLLTSVVHPIVADLTCRREQLGISQTKLAAKLGLDRKTIIRIERGYSLPNLPILEAWSATLGFALALAPAIACPIESATNQE